MQAFGSISGSLPFLAAYFAFHNAIYSLRYRLWIYPDERFFTLSPLPSTDSSCRVADISAFCRNPLLPITVGTPSFNLKALSVGI